MEEGANEFIEFMMKFYEMYPEFKYSEFYLTGVSFAGKYVSLFGNKILEFNKNNDF
jgi:carboxypeptidase C (cathepsin A)